MGSLLLYTPPSSYKAPVLPFLFSFGKKMTNKNSIPLGCVPSAFDHFCARGCLPVGAVSAQVVPAGGVVSVKGGFFCPGEGVYHVTYPAMHVMLPVRCPCSNWDWRGMQLLILCWSCHLARNAGKHLPPLDRILDTHLWKHYLPATTVTGSNNTLPNPPLSWYRFWENLDPSQHTHTPHRVRIGFRSILDEIVMRLTTVDLPITEYCPSSSTWESRVFTRAIPSAHTSMFPKSPICL